VPRWTLAALRHSAATRFREEQGIDVAAVLLGHAKPDTTLIYSSKAAKHADEAAKRVG
jgi:integrase